MLVFVWARACARAFVARLQLHGGRARILETVVRAYAFPRALWAAAAMTVRHRAAAHGSMQPARDGYASYCEQPEALPRKHARRHLPHKHTKRKAVGLERHARVLRSKHREPRAPRADGRGERTNTRTRSVPQACKTRVHTRAFAPELDPTRPTHARMRTGARAHAHTITHARTRTHTQTLYAHSHKHTRTHARSHTRMHARTHKHTRTRTHAPTWSCSGDMKPGVPLKPVWANVSFRFDALFATPTRRPPPHPVPV